MDQVLLTKKLELLKGYLAELKALCLVPDQEILDDSLKYHTAERLLQLVTDTAVDINIHLIRESGGPAPDDLQSTFLTLGQKGILPVDLAEKMAPVVGLRNRIVHRYDTLSRADFVGLLKKNLTDFERYLEVVIELVVRHK